MQTVTLDDQWTDPFFAVVESAKFLCAPVTKTIGDVIVPPLNPVMHYVMYQVAPDASVYLENIYIGHQFDGGLIKAKTPS